MSFVPWCHLCIGVIHALVSSVHWCHSRLDIIFAYFYFFSFFLFLSFYYISTISQVSLVNHSNCKCVIVKLIFGKKSGLFETFVQHCVLSESKGSWYHRGLSVAFLVLTAQNLKRSVASARLTLNRKQPELPKKQLS